MTTSSQGNALINGASPGIGASTPTGWRKRGYDLILVARDASRLDNSLPD